MSSVVRAGNESLDPAELEAYKFADQSYLGTDKRGDLGDYTYDKDMSDANTAVWHNHTQKKTHVSNRGSTTAYDWGVSDVQIGLGRESKGSRFKKAVKVAEDAHKKYGYTIDTSGHSLGGTASSYQTQELGNNDWYGKATTFNSGVSAGASIFSKHRKLCSRTNPDSYCGKITHLKEDGDAVSNRNVLCDVFTLGMKPKFCSKRDPFGKTKVFSHSKGKWWRPLSNRVKPHSLTNFVRGKK